MAKKIFTAALFSALTIFLGLSIACFDGGGSDSGATNNGDPGDPQATLTIDKVTVTFNSNKTATITATAKKEDGTDDTITAESSNVSVATVTVSGLEVTLTGKTAGTTTITITSGSGLKKTCAATVNPSWHTVFEDDFNRADSPDNNLGPNWEVWDSSYMLIKIFGDRLSCAYKPGGDGGSPKIKYTQTINGNIIRMSMKVTTSEEIDQDYQRIVLCVYKDDEGYAAAVIGGKMSIINNADEAKLSECDYNLVENTTYIAEFILEEDLLTFNLKDDSGNILKTRTAARVISFDSFRLFIGAGDPDGGVHNKPSYIDDFLIEVFK